jgi:NAD+ kinase
MAESDRGIGLRRFGLVANPTKEGAAALARMVVDRLGAAGWEAMADEETSCLLEGAVGVHSIRAIGEAVEFIVVLGGDGTILTTARRFGAAVRPLAAINTGRLGFLTTAAAEDLEAFVRALTTGAYEISPRTLLEVRHCGADGGWVTATALNEATLTRGRQPRMINVEARIDGEVFNRYRGDGLIVATPTGSTAYSLSAGGSIVSPKARVFLVTPICSHTLADRSLIVGDDAELEFVTLGESEETLLTLDGDDSISLPAGVPVVMRRAGYDLPLVALPGHSFYRLLQAKLGWSGSSVPGAVGG